MRSTASALALTLALAGSAAAQQMRGRVIEVATGASIADAALAVFDRDGRERARAVSDSAGRFLLPLPYGGRFSLRVEHIAYTMLETESFEVDPGELIDVEVRLAVGVIPLEPLVVTGRQNHSIGRAREFYERLERGALTGSGRFIGREELERYPGTSVSLLISRFPGVRIRPVGFSNGVFMTGPTGECPPAIFIDGVEVAGFNTEIDHFTSPDMLEGVEVYRSPISIPVEYRRNNNCGAVLLWSREARGGRPFSWKRLLIGAGGFLLLVVTVGRL